MNITTWFSFSIVTLIIFAIISNSSPTGLTQIEFQFHRLTCPLPLSNGIDYLNGTIIYDVDINGDSTTLGGNIDANPFTQDANVTVGSFYRCTFDPLSAPPGLQTSTTIKEYGANCFSVIPCGLFGYIGDYLGSIGEKVGAFFTLLAFALTPINFNMLGYTISDIGGIGLMLVIGLYIFCYIGIGVFLYKTATPFGGVS